GGETADNSGRSDDSASNPENQITAGCDSDNRVVFVAVIALLIQVWVLVSDVHFLWKPHKTNEFRTQVAQIESIVREAKVRSSAQLSWFKVSASQTLYEGDELATLEDSYATLKFQDGQKITLGPNSLLVLRR